MHDALARPEVHGADPERVHVEVLPEDPQALLDLRRGHEHVLDHVLRVVELLQGRGRRDLQERHGGRQHPAEAPSEERAVAQRHDVLHLPEHRPAVPVVVVPERDVLYHGHRRAGLRPGEHVAGVLVEVLLVPLAVLVQRAVLPDLVGEVSDHDHALGLGEDQALYEAGALVLPLGRVQVDVVPGLGKLEAFVGLCPPEVNEGLLCVEGVVAQADVGRAGDDPQLGRHQHAEGAVGPEEGLE
mmetsp:Transcript_13367/g.26903  ORF Transcript_13367/g.26903 Transcript_13367/m.26903 type:complete len:242 (+) Transcript_13367:534-1259(+)